MPFHHVFHNLMATVRAMQMPGDVVYKAAILAAAALLLLTAGV